ATLAAVLAELAGEVRALIGIVVEAEGQRDGAAVLALEAHDLDAVSGLFALRRQRLGAHGHRVHGDGLRQHETTNAKRKQLPHGNLPWSICGSQNTQCGADALAGVCAVDGPSPVPF